MKHSEFHQKLAGHYENLSSNFRHSGQPAAAMACADIAAAHRAYAKDLEEGDDPEKVAKAFWEAYNTRHSGGGLVKADAPPATLMTPRETGGAFLKSDGRSGSGGL